jgi:8-oxo-dGTP diphosphatase
MREEKITEIIDKNTYECSLTVDCAVFGFQENSLCLLLVKRPVGPFNNLWMLPGGVMSEGETLEEAVDEVVYNLTGIYNIHCQQIKTYSVVERHPTKRVITTCFYALVKPENHPVEPKKPVSEIGWHPINKGLPKLGFDHHILVGDAISQLKQNLKQDLIFGELLPEFFTLKELQDFYESILDEKFDRRNFRKKILNMGLLISTGKKKTGAKGGPELFKMRL